MSVDLCVNLGIGQRRVSSVTGRFSIVRTIYFQWFRQLNSPCSFSFNQSQSWWCVQRVLGIAGPKKAAKAAPSSGKSARYYPADDIPKPKHSRANKHNAPRVRASLTPGTVCILLAGRFRGKRVVCLKSLESGLLLVSGPYKINGVPLRRVNQTYVIGTSTKIDVSKVDVSKIDDAYFARVKSDAASGEDEFFANDAAKPAIVSDQRKADQKKVDAEILKVVDSTPLMKNYLGSNFSLKKHDRPHKMIF